MNNLDNNSTMESMENEALRRETGGEAMFLTREHGGRPTLTRKRKGVDEYVAENLVDFTSRSLLFNGQLVKILLCRFCNQSIGARSDRIKEHLSSKKHEKLKSVAFREAAEAGRDLSQEYAPLPGPINLHSSVLPRNAVNSAINGQPGCSLGRCDGSMNTIRVAGTGTQGNLSNVYVNNNTNNNIRSIGNPNFSGGPSAGNSTISSQSQSSPISSNNPNPILPRQQSRPQRFVVEWENFASNLVTMVSKLKAEGSFVDVTLSAEGKTIKCHRIILAASSSYFEALLKEAPADAYPIIFLKDVKSWELEALVEFMYKGECVVHHNLINDFLLAAKSLQLKGIGLSSLSANEGNGFGSNCNNDINGRQNDNNSKDGHGSADYMNSSINNTSSNTRNSSHDISRTTINLNNHNNHINLHHQLVVPAAVRQQQQQFSFPTTNVLNSTLNNIFNNDDRLQKKIQSRHINITANNMDNAGVDLSKHRGNNTKSNYHPVSSIIMGNNNLPERPGSLPPYISGLGRSELTQQQLHCIPAKRPRQKKEKTPPRKIAPLPRPIKSIILPTLSINIPSQPPLQYYGPPHLQLQQHHQQPKEYHINTNASNPSHSRNNSINEGQINKIPEVTIEKCNQPNLQQNDFVGNNQDVQSNDDNNNKSLEELEEEDNETESDGLIIDETEIDEDSQLSFCGGSGSEDGGGTTDDDDKTNEDGSDFGWMKF